MELVYIFIILDPGAGIDPGAEKYDKAESKSYLDRIPNLSGNSERKGFVVKVYSLVFIMLLFPTGLVILSVYVEPVRLFMVDNLWLYIVASVIVIIMLLSLLCFSSILKRVPINYIYLLVFTILESYCVAALTSYYEPVSIMYAAILTVALGLSLTLFAIFTDADLTELGRPLCFISLGVTLAMVIMMAIVRSHWVLILCCWAFLIISGLYLIVDTQQIIGGKHIELSLDDYIIAAMMLFIDFISIFIYLLQILGKER